MTQAEKNQRVHERVIAELKKLNAQERREQLIACGILTPEGELAREYVSEEDSAAGR